MRFFLVGKGDFLVGFVGDFYGGIFGWFLENLRVFWVLGFGFSVSWFLDFLGSGFCGCLLQIFPLFPDERGVMEGGGWVIDWGDR